MKILEGLLVVSLEQAVAAPFASSRLADSGARVIKVERPSEGDFARYYDHVVNGESAYFVWINRGKESVFLDLPLVCNILARPNRSFGKVLPFLLLKNRRSFQALQK